MYTYDIFDHVVSKDELDNFLLDLRGLKKYIEDHKLSEVIEDPEVSHAERVAVVQKKLGKFTPSDKNLSEFIYNSLDQNNLELLTADSLHEISERAKSDLVSYNVVKIGLAVELKQQDLLEVRDALAKKFGQKVLLDVRIKKNLLGGFVLEKDSTTVDASLVKAIEDYGKDWVNNIS